MAVSVLWKRKCCFLFLVIAISCCSIGHSQDNPAQDAGKDLLCFNNKLIYIGCDEVFKLNQSGIINIPSDATDRFCNGPCPWETKLLLTCIDKIGSKYVFNNKATTQDIRKALDAGCSSTDNRGNFNVGDYAQGGLSNLANRRFVRRLLASGWIPCLFWLASHR